jgi:hypothetical protein
VRKYYLYKLSLRDISEMLLNRGLEVSYETVNGVKLGVLYLPEVFGKKEVPPLKINGILIRCVF